MTLYDYAAEMGYNEAKANAAWLLDRHTAQPERALELYRDLATKGKCEREGKWPGGKWPGGKARCGQYSR